eukprot:5835405-Amphidinium_carterae.1
MTMAVPPRITSLPICSPHPQSAPHSHRQIGVLIALYSEQQLPAFEKFDRCKSCAGLGRTKPEMPSSMILKAAHAHGEAWSLKG